ncbi:Uncharacterized protein TCM_011612 [Theobroma cacao]|uniref:Uncharacterized protein n=1 Tax=Theobroma cacao TaxID=3641 RepID=A0A061EBM9_THECC|nr:Uncharacterized protein TCM_011612 [Theobroma cacao]
MDLRYGVPPILNLMFLLFFSTQPGPGMWNSNLNISSILVHQFSFLELAFLFLAVMFLLLFLFTSVEVPLILQPIRFRLGAGVFSIALTVSLVASLFFPPSLFWPVYLLVVLFSPWHGMFFDLFKHFLGWFSGALQSVPTYFITITQNEESSTSAPLQDDVELGLTHGQQNLEHNE